MFVITENIMKRPVYFYLQLGLNMVTVVQYTFAHKQYTKQHNETEYNTYITINKHK